MTFTADKIITDDEIAPAIPVLNFWLNKTYPTYAGRYSASGMVGYNRLIALMIAKMTGQGHFPTGVTLPAMRGGLREGNICSANRDRLTFAFRPTVIDGSVRLARNSRDKGVEE